MQTTPTIWAVQASSVGIDHGGTRPPKCLHRFEKGTYQSVAEYLIFGDIKRPNTRKAGQKKRSAWED
jgi:hypothetical protein